MKRCFSCFKEFEEKYAVCPHCGQPEITKAKEPIQLEPGTVLANRYIVGEAVGSGGFGIVYKAWDSKLETIVAVKEFFVSRLMTRAEGLKNVIVTKKSQTEFNYRKERFLAEARNMAKFGAHRSIPNVFEFFEDNNTAYIVMELLTGIALNDYLKENNGRIDVDFAVLIANEIAMALKSLHEHNIIHRDVAPDNIFICSGKDIKIKLMDLGAAKLADSTDEVIDIILKPGYSPSEQYDNSKNIGPWTDIYALGATMYMMLTGVKPDESTNRKIKDEVIPVNQLNPLVSENLNNTIMKAMAVDKHMRFKNIDEFLSALNGDKKVIPLVKERKRRSFKRIAGIAAACAVVAVISGIVLRTYNDKRSVQYLNPATISVWFSVEDESEEEQAMKAVKADFEDKFPDISIELKAIPASEYEAAISEAAANGALPNLFESSGLPDDILTNAVDLTNVLESEQFSECLFLNQYDSFYDNKKQLPLAIEIPVAYVITDGPESAKYDYDSDYFTDIYDLGTNISIDLDHSNLVETIIDEWDFKSENDFSENSPVLLSSTMSLNNIREILGNKAYTWSCVYYNSEKINCKFIYEWSIGSGSADENAAAERLMSWMLGNNYQNMLMVSWCSDGQIPINPICFNDKIQSSYLKPINDIYNKFLFENIG